mgnify:CR=1 FL=1
MSAKVWQNDVERFRRHMETATDLAPGTQSRYLYEVGRFFTVMEVEATGAVTPQALSQWNGVLHDGGAARGTVGQKHAALRQFFQYLEAFEQNEAAGLLLRAMNQIKMPKGAQARRQPYSLPDDQFETLLEATAERPGVGIRDRALLHFLWATGARRAEARDLSLPNLDVGERVAQVLGKGNKWRTVAFDRACQKDLSNWLEARATWEIAPEVQEVFVSALGRRLDVNTVGNIVRETSERAGLPTKVWTHILRHSRATALVNHGMSIAAAAKTLGHKNPATTMGYLHPSSTELRDEYDKATMKEGDDG